MNKANLPAFCLPQLEKKQEALVTVLPSAVGGRVTSDSFLFKTGEKGGLDIEMLAPISLTWGLGLFLIPSAWFMSISLCTGHNCPCPS